jgi:hypothetical protein
MIAVVDPRQADAVMVGEGHTPVVAVLLASADEADESIPAPKGSESRTPRPFPLQTGRFLGGHDGGHDADRGPLWPAPSAASPAVMMGEDDAPVVAVLLAAAKRSSAGRSLQRLGSGAPDTSRETAGEVLAPLVVERRLSSRISSLNDRR